jgi:hypothetical protein
VVHHPRPGRRTRLVGISIVKAPKGPPFAKKGGPSAFLNTHKPCYTNVVNPDNTTEVLLPLQLIFCHSQQADQISAAQERNSKRKKTFEQLHEISSVRMRSEMWIY